MRRDLIFLCNKNHSDNSDEPQIIFCNSQITKTPFRAFARNGVKNIKRFNGKALFAQTKEGKLRNKRKRQ